MAEVMLGKELHPDRVIAVEKLYEILNKYGVEYSFPVQHGIENGAFAVVRCKDCRWWNEHSINGKILLGYCVKTIPKVTRRDEFCSHGERRTDHV